MGISILVLPSKVIPYESRDIFDRFVSFVKCYKFRNLILLITESVINGE